ncbi:MAG TPA: O-antigen ligase family protein [Terriglobales bacterium]
MAEPAETGKLAIAMPGRNNTGVEGNQRFATTVRNLLLYGVLLHLFAFSAIDLFSSPTESELVADASSDAGNLYNQLVVPAAFFTVCFLVYAHRVPRRALWAVMIPTAPMLLLIALSTLWSEYPELTIRRAFHEIIEVTTLALLATCFSSATDVLKIFFRAFLVMGCLDLLAGALFSESITSIGFAGIHGHKNLAGEFFLVAMPVFLLGALHREISGNRLIGLVALLSCMAMLILSESKTSMGAVPLGFAAMLVTRGLTNRDVAARVPWLLVCALGLLVAMIALAIWPFDELLEVLVGDPTLTGRDGIWQYAISKFAASPIVGVGYGAIWQIGPTIQSALRDMGIWMVFNEAHNGYLEIVAQLGVAGIICLLIFLTTTLRNAVSCWNTVENRALFGVGALTIYIFWGLVLSNITESLYFAAGLGYPGMLMFLAPLAASRLATRRRAGSRRELSGVGARQPAHLAYRSLH